jgi:hypothetical protein
VTGEPVNGNGEERTTVLLGPAGIALAKLIEAENEARRRVAIVGPGGKARQGPNFPDAAIARLEILITAIDRIETAQARRHGELRTDEGPPDASASPVLARLDRILEGLELLVERET